MNFKLLRKEKGLTQAEVANFLNLTPVAYNRYEKELREPNINTLCKLADFYSVSLDYLVGREFGNQLGFLTSEQFDNIKLILNLNEKNQCKVFGYALSLLENQ